MPLSRRTFTEHRRSLGLWQRDELAEERPGGRGVEPVVEAVRRTYPVTLLRGDGDEHVAAAGVEEVRAARVVGTRSALAGRVGVQQEQQHRVPQRHERRGGDPALEVQDGHGPAAAERDAERPVANVGELLIAQASLRCYLV